MRLLAYSNVLLTVSNMCTVLLELSIYELAAQSPNAFRRLLAKRNLDARGFMVDIKCM